MKFIYPFLLFGLFFIVSCNQNRVLKTHGIAYLEKREKLITVNQSNKNDIIDILGAPATKGLINDNIWIYVERTLTRGKLLKLGKNITLKNNILVLEFDNYGVLSKKEFYDKRKMNELKFDKEVTDFEGRKENFIFSFLSSIRQKMLNKSKQMK